MVEKQDIQDSMDIDSQEIKEGVLQQEIIEETESESVIGPKKKKFKSETGDSETNIKDKKKLSDSSLSEKNGMEGNNSVSKLKIEKSIADSTTPKREKSVTVDEDDVPVPEGWKRLSVQRMGGVSAGKFDIYFISPLGKKLRSKKEVMVYCEKMNIDIDIDQFIFNAGRTPGRAKKVSESPSKSTPKTKTVSTPKNTPVPKSISTPKSLSIKSTPLSKNKESPSETVSAKKSPAKKEFIQKSPKKTDEEKRTPKKKNSGFKVSSDGLIKAKLKPRLIWVPPKSPFNLFQESFYDKPWQLLAGTIVLGKTAGGDNVGIEVLHEFLKRFPTPEVTVKADSTDVAESLSTVIHKERIAKMLIKFSEEFLTKQWTYPKELHGIGKFGNDSYRVFCVNEWKKVKPSDYLLNFYVDWLWDNHTILEVE